ncbi:MAG: ABC transporter permease [Planctomycetota bacterium]
MVTEETKSDAAPARGAAAAGPEQPEFTSEYSKDYWDLVMEQLSRRFLFKVGIAVLTLLYGIAVVAPLLASDRPYLVESVDLSSYKSSLRVLRPVALTAARVAKQSDEDFAGDLAKAPTGAPATRLDKIRSEHDAAKLRIETMRSMLPADGVEQLDVYADAFQRGVDAMADGDDTAAGEAFDEAKTVVRSMRKDLKALDPAEPDAGGVPLVGRAEMPLFESIAAWEIALAALWLLWALWPLWNPLVNVLLLGRNRNRIRAARRYKFFACVGLSIVAAVAWRVSFGPVAEFDVATHKRGLTEGKIVLVADGRTTAELAASEDPEAEGLVGRLVWAPVAFGYAELHEDEKFRAPTWSRKSKLDPETGRPLYLIERDQREGEERVDDVAPAQVQVEVRAGEPGLNSAWRHPLGTDESGRDVLCRMIWGGRVSLSVGILSAALLTVIGVIIGSIAGFFGGWVDIAIMRGIEILQSIPAFFLILLALAFTDPETMPPMFAIVFVIAIVRWTGVARLVRGEFLRLREQEFVVASRALGFSSRRTIFRHVLPNAMSPVLVAAAFSVAAGILTESAVSFLGFGIREPDASWGAIVNESRNPENWWIQMFPGIAIFVTVTCYNLVGDAIRDAMDPKMKV